MSSTDPEQNPPPSDVAEREREEKERKAKEDAEQAQLPYKWTQTIRDVDVTIPIPANIKGRDMDVVMTKTKIKVAIKGQEPLIEVGHVLSLSFGSGLMRFYLSLIARCHCQTERRLRADL
jgi:hypothetical protein